MDSLANVYEWVAAVIINDLKITAAILAMMVSVATGKWRTAFAVGLLTWAFTPVFLSIMSHTEWLPEGQEKAWGLGFAAMLGVMGVHGIEERINQLDFKKMIGHVIDKIKGH